MAKVSVIVPTYQRARLVCEAIESVLEQSFRDFEIVVIDDGSTDGTAALLREVAERQREFAQIQYEDGTIDNRDKIDAENAWVNARNQLNLAKTDRWGALLEFRLATETLRVEDDGTQLPDDADVSAP
mgnify:CR=1 FL=1